MKAGMGGGLGYFYKNAMLLQDEMLCPYTTTF